MVDKKPEVTAKVKVTKYYESPEGSAPEQVIVDLTADYEDGRNQEWARYTPHLNISMTLKPEVARSFQPGRAYTLTFTPED